MTIVTYAARNLGRNKLRVGLTVFGVAIAVVAFVGLRTVLSSWNAAADHAAKDRLGTRHKISFVFHLPVKYAEDIRNVKGVTQSTWCNWFGGKDPAHPDEFFATLACDHHTLFDVYDEMALTPAEREAWRKTPNGAVLGDVLARKLGKKVGDRLVLESQIYPGQWELQVVGIYHATRRSVDRSTLLFHWEFANNDPRFLAKDKVGWIITRIDDPTRSAELSKTIDALFEDRDEQTLTMSERSMNLSFLGMLSAVLEAIDVVSIVILVILMLIVGNTIAMGVRERTHEYGVLRAIGFQPGHLVTFVLLESILVGGLGGGLGLVLSYPMIQQGLGRSLEENAGQLFPYFRISPTTALFAIGLAVALAALAASIPAYQAARLRVTEALRRIA